MSTPPAAKLVSFDPNTPAGLYISTTQPTIYRVLGFGRPEISFDTTKPCDPAVRDLLLRNLERVLARGGARWTTPFWNAKRRADIARYLSGEPLPVARARGLYQVSTAPPVPVFRQEAEKFAQRPTDAEAAAAVLENADYRRVLYTPHPDEPDEQLVAMSVMHWVPPEVHTDTTQIFTVYKGVGAAYVEDATINLEPGVTFSVGRGQRHEIRAYNEHGPLKLLSVYSPSHHLPGRVDAENTDIIDVIARG
jgi:mannose-6-phosphate isomerase-like protein (cupin superfamily)